MNYLVNSYAIHGGEIVPYGTINILAKGVREPIRRNEHDSYKPGLPMWCEKILGHAQAGHRAVVAKNTVNVICSNGRFVTRIRHSEFRVVQVWPSYVHANGYLQASITRKYLCSDADWCKSLDEADSGKTPTCLDNSAYTKIDQSFSGQEVIAIEVGHPRASKKVIVYSKNGEVIDSLTRHPLSFARWAPQSEVAQYGFVD